mgnify:FL=1
MLIQLENGQPMGHPVLEETFRALHPEMLFPPLLTPEIVEPLGFGIFAFTPAPLLEERYDKLVEATPERDANGIWRQLWQIVPMTEAERAVADAQQAETARHARELKLRETDFSQLADAPAWVDRAAWAAYRQALRDLPQQTGFPWQIIWPEPPES